MHDQAVSPEAVDTVTTGSDRELLERFDLVFAATCSSQRDLLTYVAATGNARFYERDGYPDHASWLAGRFHVSTWMAHRWINAASALANLPLISEALSSGRLSLDKVLELARMATPETEKALITWARRVSPGAIRRRADRAARQELEDTQTAEEDRSLRWWDYDEGKRIGFLGDFPAAQGAAIAKALTRLADKIPVMPYDEDLLCEPSPEDLRVLPSHSYPLMTVRDGSTRFETRCADALSLLASQALSQDPDADRATVVVHTELGSETGSYIEDGPVLHPEVARRISCDARLQFVVYGRPGDAVGIGRTSRNIPHWLWRQLKHRDGGCTFPGCGRRAYLQGHHIWHWEDGGPTDLANLVLVCGFHHKLLHEFGWMVWLHGSEVRWVQTGRTPLRSRAGPAAGAGPTDPTGTR